jgi:hypothetical protein
MERTEELLSENRLEIFAVSHALEAHKTITGDDVLAIIDGRQGPLIDGRRYHTPKFKELAEDYHEQVVVAHINHGHVDVSLPELPELDAQGEPPSTANVAPTGVHANGSDAHVGTSSEET